MRRGGRVWRIKGKDRNGGIGRGKERGLCGEGASERVRTGRRRWGSERAKETRSREGEGEGETERKRRGEEDRGRGPREV